MPNLLPLFHRRVRGIVHSSAAKPGADGRALVMVVSGRAEYKGKHADVLQRSKGGNSVTVQMKHDDAVVQLTMDDVCEYVGALQE